MSNVSNTQKHPIFSWHLCLAFVLAAAATMLPDIVYATDTPIGNVFCTLSGWIGGNTGKGLATIAVLIVSVGALLGKVSWGIAIIVALGVALVFGAQGVINMLVGTVATVEGNCNTNASFG